MTFAIPEWVLWVLGIPAGVAVLGLAVLGVQLIKLAICIARGWGR